MKARDYFYIRLSLAYSVQRGLFGILEWMVVFFFTITL